LALRVLRELGRTTLGERLALPDVESLETRDRAFLHQLVLGTLRQRGWLDHALSGCLEQPLSKLDGGVLDILRLGAHQILSLRVPDRAAVSESVELAAAEWPRAKGLVNAVLRRLARQGAPPEPDPAKDALAWLTTAGSLPVWLAERWFARLGPTAAVARARAFLEPAPVVFRLNPRSPDAWAAVEALEPRALAVPGAWQTSASPPPELARGGVLYAQALGSQLVAHLAAGRGRLLDACAAPGGKTTLAADIAGEGGAVVAAESSARRLASLVDHVRRWGSPNVTVLAADALRPPFRGSFDRILVDAPCSGLGTLSRNPDVRWRVAEADLARHGQRQQALLRSLVPLLAPGGTLVYSVCSLEPEENQAVLAALRDELVPQPPPEWAQPFTTGRTVTTLPEREGGDGFFAAVLRSAGS
jgi:16S rRNA (cytosine967-C5)-methyltransferase